MATITADAPALHGPHPLPVLGWRFNYLEFTRDPISYLDRVYRTYGKLATMAEGTQDYIFVFEPEYLRQILSDQMLFYNLTLADWPISIQFPQNTSFDRLMDGLLPMNGGAPMAAGTFRPDTSGNAMMNHSMAEGMEAKAFAVTIEPEGGSQTPTMPIKMMTVS